MRQKSTVVGALMSVVLVVGGNTVHSQALEGVETVKKSDFAQSYETKDIDVTEELKDPFGNNVTEQSY